jgi:hypothetical protein
LKLFRTQGLDCERGKPCVVALLDTETRGLERLDDYATEAVKRGSRARLEHEVARFGSGHPDGAGQTGDHGETAELKAPRTGREVDDLECV